MKTVVAFMIVSVVTAVVEMWIHWGTKNGVEKFAKEVK